MITLRVSTDGFMRTTDLDELEPDESYNVYLKLSPDGGIVHHQVARVPAEGPKEQFGKGIGTMYLKSIETRHEIVEILDMLEKYCCSPLRRGKAIDFALADLTRLVAKLYSERDK